MEFKCWHFATSREIMDMGMVLGGCRDEEATGWQGPSQWVEQADDTHVTARRGTCNSRKWRGGAYLPGVEWNERDGPPTGSQELGRQRSSRCHHRGL